MSTITYYDGISRQMTIANSLTLFRAIATIPFVAFVFFEYTSIAFLVLVCAAVSDLEGELARRTNTTTELGRVMDPLADKVFVDIALVVLGFVHGDPLILVLWALAIGYDIDNTVRRSAEFRPAALGEPRAQADLPVNALSKVKTATLFITVGVLVAPIEWRMLPVFGTSLVVLSINLVCFSWFHNRRGVSNRFFRL